MLQVRATGPKGKASEWSNPASLAVIQPLKQPSTPKPHKQIYEKLVVKHGVDPTRACMADDIAVNLKPAGDMGMRTVWIRTEESVKRAADLDLSHIHHETDDLATWLADWLAERKTQK